MLNYCLVSFPLLYTPLIAHVSMLIPTITNQSCFRLVLRCPDVIEFSSTIYLWNHVAVMGISWWSKVSKNHNLWNHAVLLHSRYVVEFSSVIYCRIMLYFDNTISPSSQKELLTEISIHQTCFYSKFLHQSQIIGLESFKSKPPSV